MHFEVRIHAEIHPPDVHSGTFREIVQSDAESGKDAQLPKRSGLLVCESICCSLLRLAGMV